MSAWITPDQIKQQALKLWQSGRFLSAMASGEVFFPREIRFGKPNAQTLVEQFGEVRDWIRTLKDHSKEAKGYGYSLEYRAVNHRQLGAQNIPARILFENEEDFLRFVGKQTEYRTFCELRTLTTEQCPNLQALFVERPLLVRDNATHWPKLLAVCGYFAANPKPAIYLRQVDIAGIDTKFIERHRSVLSQLLDRVLPTEAVNADAGGLAGHGFERRYGMRYDPPQIRLRILDAGCAIQGLQDLSLPLSDFARLDSDIQTVFITENKTNGLAFPEFPRAAVVFGLGYGIQSLAKIDWLKHVHLYYWGDIDTHGFAILSQLRGCYPQTRSVLMDRETLEIHRELWGREEQGKRETRALTTLTDEENALYRDIVESRLAEHLRLEQELITYSYVQKRVQALQHAAA